MTHSGGTASVARSMWHLLEPLHAVVYFGPEPRAALADAGLRGFWMGYFASRSAAMGAVGAEVVTSTFYNFAPRHVSRAIPDAWGFASPNDVLAARQAGVDAALVRVLGTTVAHLDEAADLAWQAVEACRPEGRPLFAAHAALDRAGEPHVRLWQAATALREHRGDGHVISLVNAEIDGCQAHVLAAAAGRATREVLQPNRGWTDDEWSDAEDGLRRRGWLDGAGSLTAEGRRGVESIEAVTDRLAAAPWEALGASSTDRLVRLVTPYAAAIDATREMPFPNPIGLPPPGEQS